jgi:hypothetical protein
MCVGGWSKGIYSPCSVGGILHAGIEDRSMLAWSGSRLLRCGDFAVDSGGSGVYADWLVILGEDN